MLILRRIWNDPVWSKVVAGLILGALALVWTWIESSRVQYKAHQLADWLFQEIAGTWELVKLPMIWLTSDIVAPSWSFALGWLLACMFVPAFFFVRWRYLRFSRNIQAALGMAKTPIPEIKPIPSAGASVGRPFGQLSETQRNYLVRQYRRGTRQFSEHSETSQMRWFEELQNWKYIEYVKLPMFVLGAPSPYNITEEGWRELEASA